MSESAPDLAWRNVDALPLVHGRLAFAAEARLRLLERRYRAVAVELPPSLAPAMHRALDALPVISVVLQRQQPAFLEGADARVWYVATDPGDGIVEALRIARGERTPTWFVDAEIEELRPRPMVVPDALAIRGLGLETWYGLVLPMLRLQPRTAEDGIRERHMAARLATLSDEIGSGGRILFLCGLAHWEGVRGHLEADTGRIHPEEGPAPELVTVEPVAASSLVHVVGEMPWVTWHWERHRSGIEIGTFDPVPPLKELLLEARDRYEKAFPDSLERASTWRLALVLRYLRKLTVLSRRLMPDAYGLAVAARGCVGNDYAVKVVETIGSYPPNEAQDGGLPMTADQIRADDGPTEAIDRAPGEASELRPLALRRRPERRRAARWARSWDPHSHCSWPPEDVVIERFRAHVQQRALAAASLHQQKTEPFTASLKDGVAIRETMRDWHRGRIHVKEDPPVVGDVGALVVIFEEDDDGMRFPWRTTWMAEHEEESTLAFYGTDPRADMVGPGIGRLFYGGCLFIYPPVGIPDVWEDLRFEQARTPSERLLLAALFHGQQRYVVHVGARPPSPEIGRQATALGRHVIHLPLSTFAARTLERLRRAHVLNGTHIRGWASSFI